MSDSRPHEKARWRLGFRGEILFLLPAALLLLLLVSLFTLFSYRNALSLFAEERRAAAAAVAASAATALAAAGERPQAEALHRAAPEAERVLLVAVDGTVLARWSGPRASPPSGEPLAALARTGTLAALGLSSPIGLGPGDDLPDGVVAGFAPLGPPANRRVLRCDLPSGALAGQVAAIGPLTAVVLAADAAVLLLLLFFLRHLLTPFNALLERARSVAEGSGGEAERDEVAFLLRTFERAVEALARPAGPPADEPGSETGSEADIAALSRTLASSLDSGVLLLDHQAQVLALNAVGAELLGIEEPPAGTPVAQVLSGHPRLERLIADAVAGRRGVRRAEVEIAGPLGTGGAESRILGITAHPLRRNDGAVRGFLALFADLTESRRRAEEARLEQSLAQLGELSAGIAHELRNSLATLRGYLTLIARSPGEERVGDYLAEIRRETDHLQRVLEDFLAFARPGTARLEPVALAALARRAAADPALGPGGNRDEGTADGDSASAAEVAVTVAVDAAAEGVLLPGDPSLLERAVRNLLHNAVQAQREGRGEGPVEVAVTVRPGGVEITVADRGPGVPAAMRGRLFHPFSTGRADGVGLGLALTHRIATLHGGTVRLEDRPGGGSVAVLAFPAEGATATDSSTAGGDTPRQNRYEK